VWIDHLKITRVAATFLCTVCFVGSAWAEEYLSNLGNLWPDPSGHTIGDIEVLDSGYGPFIVHLSTGSGLSEPRYAKVRIGTPTAPTTNHTTIQQFQLDSATFEFQGGIAQPWSNMTIQVCQQVGSNGLTLGDLGDPSLNPRPKVE